MGTHIRTVEDPRGDLVDVYYFCSEGCWGDSFGPLDESKAGLGGAAPCAEDECDGDVYCDACGVLMHSADGKPTPLVVNLITPTGKGRLGRI